MKSTNQSLLAIASTLMLSVGVAYQSTVQAAPATFNSANLTLTLPEVDLHDNNGVSTWSASLKLVSSTEPFILELTGAGLVAPEKAMDRSTFFSDSSYVYMPDVQVNGESFFATMKLIPGSNPFQFEVDQLVSNDFTGCPDFSTDGPVEGSCELSGKLTQDAVLTNNVNWLISGAFYVGGDNTDSAELTINPGSTITGLSGADFMYVRRGSSLMAEGTPNNPIVFTGPTQELAGEWGGLLIAGNAPVNGCADSVETCELAFEAIATELFGGNDAEDSSGTLKYVQVNYAGFAVRPEEELNGLTLLGVGAGTLLDYVQVHKGLDDGIEFFGGTANMKHIVLSHIADDSLDWANGWRGNAQFILIQQGENIGDRGIEADNFPDNNDSSPRSLPTVSNITALGSASSSQGAILREGTGANLFNSVFQGFADQCLRIDHTATYVNAGSPNNLSGELTIEDSYVNCETNFKDEPEEAFLTSDWFAAQAGNVAGDPMLEGYLPAADSPLTTGGNAVADEFFTPVSFIGAFENADDDWTQEWTTAF